MRISIKSAVEIDYTSVGYGVAINNIYRSLLELGHEVFLDDPSAPVQLNWMQPHMFKPRAGQYQILYFPWESTQLLDGWLEICNSDDVDEVWTTSDWCANVYRDAGIRKPIKVFNHGIESIWTPRKRVRQGPVKFLHVGGPANRKGHQEAFDAFFSVFEDNPKATLTIKCNEVNHVRWYDQYRRVHSPDEYGNVNIITKKLPTSDLVKLYHDHDVLIYPSCLSEDTEILTESGWRGPDQISIGDMVAATDEEGKLCYVSVEDKFDYKYSGDMVMVRNASHDLRVTANHEMIVQTQGFSPKRMNAAKILELSDSRKALPVIAAPQTGEVAIQMFYETFLSEHVSSESVSGERVWCVKNEHSSIVTRRNNKITIMGNCGEGWGLIPHQALATGMPTLCTEEWAPYREYLFDLGIDSHYANTKFPGEHPGDMCWPEQPSIENNIRKVFDNFDEYADLFFRQTFALHNRYDWKTLTEAAFADLVEKFD